MLSKAERGNEQFVTTDVKLGAYLLCSDVELLDIQPLPDGQRSRFVFQHPPQHLLDAWLAGNPQAHATRIIDCYRHLIRDSRHVREGGRPTGFGTGGRR